MDRRNVRRGIIGILAGAVLAGNLPARAASWRRVEGVAAGAVTALASDASGGRIAAAAGGTIFVSEDGGGRWRAGERRSGDIADLLYLRRGPHAGALAAAGSAGARVSRDGHTWQALDLAGQGTRGSVRAIAEDPRGSGAIALGTEAGILLATPEGVGWRSAGARLAGRTIDRLAWDAGGTLHAASEDGLYRIGEGGREVHRDVGRPTTWVAASGKDTLAVTDRGFFVARDAGAFRDLPGTREMAYLPARFAAEPGAAPGFLAAAPGRLFRVRLETGIERLGDGPPGEAVLTLLALPGGRVLAGTDRGLFEIALAGDSSAAAPRASARAPAGAFGETGTLWVAEPGIEDVRREVLRANQLDPGRIARNFHGARWRAIMPSLSLSAHRLRVRGLDRGADETFSSNAVRRLFDESSDRERRVDLVAEAEWDLGALLFNPDELDVSDESRRLVTLRDDVLDEVNQIYFERRRAILALLRMGGPESEESDEVLELRIRIDELTAKLDAWTGGYFSREIARRISAR